MSWRKARERGVVVNSNNNAWMNWWLLVFKCLCLCQFFNNKNASHNVWAKMKKGLRLSDLVHCQWTLTWEADDGAASSSTRMGFQRWTGSWGSLGSSEHPDAAVHLGRSGWAHLPDGKNSCVCGNAYGLLRSRWLSVVSSACTTTMSASRHCVQVLLLISVDTPDSELCLRSSV